MNVPPIMDLFFVAQPKTAVLLLSGLPLRCNPAASSNTAYLGVARREIGDEVSVLSQIDAHYAISRICGSARGTIGSRAYFWRDAVKNLAICLAAGASALFMTTASAAPLSANVSVAPESNIQNVRMVCNENGRCWRERGERRVIIREPDDSYAYAPRERYIERRGCYEGRGYEERGGIGFRAPGVSVGIGTDRY